MHKKINTYKTNIPKGVGIIPLIQMEYNLWKLDKMALKVPLDDPKNCELAKYWDSMTVHTWLQKNIWFEKVRKLF